MVYTQALYWDDSFAIARKLNEIYSDEKLEGVSLDDIYNWTLDLEGFKDEPSLANDNILSSIFNEWLEITLD
ncbi:MAG: Fe-S cluster assembly protein IscX [candidate division Zixibacteria bacterium]|nr:Fe-S cluster assembly protein IscX [candidate division Zixibacteria bacterium]NIR68286.1 Fe-S cluster assembly protein IscX [candidate division Zixibacteria bacterium]NIS49454.1 Fe-S cluster assembly protein IscX [candidate division Zixibacteria bacterium]NIU17535.1 Fe-S cluster assembly protein IscX [candidate division Zixibacteria bacterium]NIV09684.1 Fe-S cluster assembly protein IscX [candidate division Zixibacteria bacterium]